MSYMLIYTNKHNINISKHVLFRLLYFETSQWSDPETLAMMGVVIQ
jgi:hypothetical protein